MMQRIDELIAEFREAGREEDAVKLEKMSNTPLAQFARQAGG